jgi:DNA-binding NtrC family response regulator
MTTALIVDDSMDDLLQIADVFRDNGYSVETAQAIDQARDSLLKRMPEVAVFNETVDGKSSLDLLEQLDLSRVVEIYLLTSTPTVRQATRAMRVGVSDYFSKPLDIDRLSANLRELKDELECDRDDTILKNGRGLMVGESLPMQRLFRMIRKCAPSDASVLISGESGAGKELVAVAIHNLSERAACDMVTVNCTAIAHDLMESELFGHKKGSFTGATKDHRGFFERASGGTLFLDEIAEMDIGLQAKLLRALETCRIRPVGGESDITADVRVIAATNRDPSEAMEEGQLREDLFYRLAQFPIRVPPLRERSDDIELLADHFLAARNSESGIEKSLSDDVREAFRMYDWPGNVRELKNAVIQSHLLAGSEIQLEDIDEKIRFGVSGGDRRGSLAPGAPLSDVERYHILQTLERFDGDKKKAAKTLGISLKTLYNRLNEYREEQ